MLNDLRNGREVMSKASVNILADERLMGDLVANW